MWAMQFREVTLSRVLFFPKILCFPMSWSKLSQMNGVGIVSIPSFMQSEGSWPRGGINCEYFPVVERKIVNKVFISNVLSAHRSSAKLLFVVFGWNGIVNRWASLNMMKTCGDRKSTRLNSSHRSLSRMPSSA